MNLIARWMLRVFRSLLWILCCICPMATIDGFVGTADALVNSHLLYSWLWMSIAGCSRYADEQFSGSLFMHFRLELFMIFSSVSLVCLKVLLPSVWCRNSVSLPR